MRLLFIVAVVLASLSITAEARAGGLSSVTRTGGKLVAVSAAAKVQDKAPAKGAISGASVASVQLPDSAKLVIGALGIYGAFLYYGIYQEDVFDFKAKDGSRFKSVWLLNAIEAVANVVVGGSMGMLTGGMTKGLPLQIFAKTGVSQVFAKAFTLTALAQGVSFPIVTLAKSGKMVPVMIGSILLGGAKYTLREYASVAAIILGTVMVSLGGKKSSAASSTLGLICIALSLAFDGLTGGLQKQMKEESKRRGVKASPYDFMFWINLFMVATASTLSLVSGDFSSGVNFCRANPIILEKMLKFAACSALGQTFIFYTIANFDPLVCTTVTTTRKVFSVLLSIFVNGHKLSPQGWAGIAVASSGIMSELADKSGHKAPGKSSAAKDAPKKK